MAIVGSRAVAALLHQSAHGRRAGAQGAASRTRRRSGASMPPRSRPSRAWSINPANGQRLSYGEIAAFGKIPATLPAVDPKELKARKDFRLIGKTDAAPRHPAQGERHGAIRHRRAAARHGLRHGAALAGAHRRAGELERCRHQEDAGRDRARCGCPTASPSSPSISSRPWPRATRSRPTGRKAKAAGFDSGRALEDYVHDPRRPEGADDEPREKGDVKAAFAGAAKTYKAEFRSDYGYHAQMEPLNAVVRINDAGTAAEVWEGSQAPDATRDEVAKALGLKPEQVTMHQCYMGGGFGRRSLGDYAAECARIAKEVRRPVKLIWTREEDIAHGMFRPQSFQCLEAAHRRDRQGDRLEALRRRRRRRAAAHRHQAALLRHPQPAHRAARRVARHPPQALARGRPRVQHLRHRELRRPDGGGRRAWTRSSSASSACRSRRRRANASRRSRRCATGRPSGRTAARSASRSPSARARSAPAWSRSRSTERPARSRCTRSGSRSTAASSSRPAPPRPTSRAPSSTASPASCTSA